MIKERKEIHEDSYEEADENFRDIDSDEEDRPYFPPEESKPPHY